MEEIEKDENIDFRWGKKKGIGGKKKDVTFYESFTYDGVEYSLYDTVYLYKEGEPEPYIGKILKIWQNPDKTRKVKIIWFFRPCEILNYLRGEDTRNNELFLASGDGVGLANVNPLEVIAGKCDVICISNDTRNPQPLDEALKKADFVFWRTFDVGKLEVHDELCDKIAGVEVKCLLNKVDSSKDVKRPDKDGKSASGNEFMNTESEDPYGQNTSEENIGLKASLPKHKSFNEEKSGDCASDEGNGMSKICSKQETILDDKVSQRLVIDSYKTQGKHVITPVKDVESEDRVKSSKGSAEVEHRPAKKAKLDSSYQLSPGKTKNNPQKSGLNCNNGDTLVSSPKVIASEDASKTKNVKGSHGREDGLIKKLRPDEKRTNVSNGKILKTSSRVTSDKNDKTDGQVVDVTRRPDADRSRWFKGLPWDERIETAHEQGRLVLIANLDPAYTSGEVEDIVWHAFNESCTAKMVQRTAFSIPHIGQAYVVFKTKEAAGKAVTKLNEGLLVVNGRAVVGRFATPRLPAKKPTFFGHHSIDKIRHQMPREMVLSNALLHSSNLPINKNDIMHLIPHFTSFQKKILAAQKDAVSTSHCSQPNTVEYDMAMEWCLLQERSELSCKKLFKQQQEELRKLGSKLKFR